MTIRQFGVLLKQAAIKWDDDEASWLAAALAFYTIFSLAPLIIIFIAVLGYIFEAQAVQGEIQRQINAFIGEQAARLVSIIVTSANESGYSGTATVIGAVLLIFGASSVFTNLQGAINKIWQIKTKSARSLIKSQIFKSLISVVIIMGIGFILFLLILADTLFAGFHQFMIQVIPDTIHIDIIRFLNNIVSFIIATTLIAVIFNRLPETKVAWRDAWTGSLLTAILFTTGKLLMNFYIENSRIIPAFGPASSVIVILLWFYISAQILFFGAEFTYIYAKWRTGKQESVKI